MNVGVKAHHDPRLADDMATLRLDLDASEWHTYAVEWDPAVPSVRFEVDGSTVRTVEQRIDYPLQLMVDLFEVSGGPDRDPATYPKHGDVRAVRGFSRPPA